MTFQVQISICTGVLMLLLNISMIVLYFQYAGTPFKSEEHFKNVRHCGFVVMYWSLAFVVKLITAPFQSVNFDFATNFNTEVKDKQTDYDYKSIFQLICFFALQLVCDIVSFMIVTDSSFIKILTFDLIYLKREEENQNIDLENGILLNEDQVDQHDTDVL